MRAWFSLSLGDALMAWEPLGRIEALFQSANASAGDPDEMAVFVRYESEGRLHCEVTAFFSPAAAELAQEVEAIPCARPSPEGLSLALGNEASWTKLFPDRDG
jgi:hypothetical protein